MTTYYSNADRGYRLTYIVDEVSTSTAKNSSQVRFRLYLTTGSNSYALYTFGGSVWVDGQYTFTAPSALGFNSNHLLIDRTIEIPHDSNGNKTVTVSARLNGPGGYAPGMLSISDKKFELTKIARASSVKSTDGYFGDTLAITITRSDASFTHDVTYTFEGLSGTVANGVATSTTLVTQLGWMSKIPNVKSGNGKIIIATKSGIPHDSNGNKTVTVSARLNGPGGYAPGMLSISDKKFELTKIARASSVKSTDGYFGDTLAITITRSDASFTHDVTYTFEGLSGTVANGVATSTTLVTQLGWMSKIPNVKSGNGKIIIATKSGSTVIGTSETPFTLTVPDTIKPKLTGLTFTDTNTKVPPVVGANTFVQIVSNPSVTFNGAVGAYGSTIETYTAKILDKDQVVYSNGGTFGILQWFGQATVEATVTDSRGQVSDPFRTTMNVIEYKGVSLDFKVDRGAVNANQLVVTVTASVSPLLVGGVQKNKMIISFKTAPTGTQTFTIDTSSASTTYTSRYALLAQQFVLSGTFDSGKSFDVYGTLTDAFGVGDSKKVPVLSQFKALTLMDGGSPTNSGLGVNKKWEKGAVDAVGDVHTTGKYYQNGKLIQNYQITDDTGKTIKMDNVDLNTITTDTSHDW